MIEEMNVYVLTPVEIKVPEEPVEETKCPCGCEDECKDTALPVDVVKDIQNMLEVIALNIVKDSYGEDIYADWMKKYSM